MSAPAVQAGPSATTFVLSACGHTERFDGINAQQAQWLSTTVCTHCGLCDVAGEPRRPLGDLDLFAQDILRHKEPSLRAVWWSILEDILLAEDALLVEDYATCDALRARARGGVLQTRKIEDRICQRSWLLESGLFAAVDGDAAIVATRRRELDELEVLP